MIFKMAKSKIIKEGNKKYVIDEKMDLVIFNKIKELEKLKLNKKDREMVRLIKTQLEKDWRKYLVQYLNEIRNK